MNYLGLDIGTSVIKGQLLNENGSILLSREYESPIYSIDGVAFIKAKKMKEIFKAIIEELAKSSEEKIEYYQTLIDKEADRSEQIAQFEKEAQTTKYIEEVARVKFGLVKDKEIIFKAE